VPVRVSGALAAFLVLDASDERVGFPARAVEDGELLAAQLGALLQRLALEDALRAERERLDYLAHHDPLTDLPNRALLGERLALTLARDRREGALTALFVIDLDGFKALNDRFGHAAGDELLVAVGHGLRGAVRAGDTVARWGGDEFAIVAGAVADRAGGSHGRGSPPRGAAEGAERPTRTASTSAPRPAWRSRTTRRCRPRPSCIGPTWRCTGRSATAAAGWRSSTRPARAPEADLGPRGSASAARTLVP
jgi:GGDEF domain-containing protein